MLSPCSPVFARPRPPTRLRRRSCPSPRSPRRSRFVVRRRRSVPWCRKPHLAEPETRDPKWEARSLASTAKASTQAARIDLVFDGDSITDFWQRTGRAVWATAFAKYHPFDFGISGDTTQNLLWRLAHGQAQGLHPKVIMLMIGTNDMKFTSTPQEIADGVKEILQQYRKLCPEAVIVLQAIFPRAASPNDPYRLKVNATNPLLAKLADGSKIIYLDFGAKFLATDGTLGADIMPDFLHPSAKGYQIWADAITPVLEKYLSEKPTPSVQ
ncbi:MAG: GDSL-type esterase/lipase family protein [Chthoniobacteraceae bacterium]